MSDEEPEMKEPGRLDRINDTLGTLGSIASAVKGLAEVGVSLYQKGQELGFIGKKETTSSESETTSNVRKTTLSEFDKYYALGNVSYDTEDYEGAIESFTKAIESTEAGAEDFDYINAHYCRGRAFFFKESYDMAIDDFKMCVVLSKGELDSPYYMLALSFIEKGNYAVAIKNLTKAIEIEGSASYYDLRVRIYDKVISDYTEAIRVNPNDVEAYCNRGNAYNEKGDCDKAIADYESALRIDPNHSDAQEALDDLKRKKETSFTDSRDGKVYKIVKIGDQVWMAENLNFDCPKSKCYDNDPKNAEKYGRLYDWETAKKACPSGWRLPSKEEWDGLVDFAGGENTAGKKLKAESGWNDDEGKSGNGTDNYGFSALPGGSGYSDGSFSNVGDGGYWWSATEYNAYNAYYRLMCYDDSNVIRSYGNKSYLYSVRCVQDKA
jgi:uncharacterized protein (TIGR02145 family)